MADFCAKICVKESFVRFQSNHTRHVCVEDDEWWVLQLGEEASSSQYDDLSICEEFRKDPWNAARRIGKDCAYVALRKSDKTLFVARDPFGFLPIRYARTATGWIVWTGPIIPKEVHRRVNYERLAGFIAHRPDAFEEDYWVGVNRVLPGHCIRFTRSGLRKKRYYPTNEVIMTSKIMKKCLLDGEMFLDPKI